MERLKSVGNTTCLLNLAQRVGNVKPVDTQSKTINLTPMTMINEKSIRLQSGDEKITEVVEGNEKITEVVEGDKITKENGAVAIKQHDDDVITWKRNRVEIHNWGEWEHVDKRVTELVIPSKCCNEGEWRVFDVSELRGLKRIKIGDECFENVNEVKLIGLHALERVLIGKKSFTKNKNGAGKDPNRHFYLKDCERLKELKMGCCSFNDFTVCEIANVPSLEVIEMGEVDEYSFNFCHASLKLKSDGDEMN